MINLLSHLICDLYNARSGVNEVFEIVLSYGAISSVVSYHSNIHFMCFMNLFFFLFLIASKLKHYNRVTLTYLNSYLGNRKVLIFQSCFFTEGFVVQDLSCCSLRYYEIGHIFYL